MMLASVYGRLGKDPRTIDSAKTPMSVTSIAVDLKDRSGNRTTQWMGLLAFGSAADLLAKHKKGELVSASGRVQINTWTNNHGENQVELQLVADSIISASAARPSGRREPSEHFFEPEEGGGQFVVDDDISF